MCIINYHLSLDADENILNGQGKAAADVVGEDVGEEDSLAESTERVRKLFNQRSGRQRMASPRLPGVCRAHHNPMQQMRESSKATPAGGARSIATTAALERAEASHIALRLRQVGRCSRRLV